MLCIIILMGYIDIVSAIFRNFQIHWEKFSIGTSMSVSGNVACRLHSADEGNTHFWRYFSGH